MQDEKAARVIHHYDTQRHAVDCGVTEQTSSTKHERGVTCPDCLEIQRENRPAKPSELHAPMP
jgi:hypothetical protein